MAKKKEQPFEQKVISKLVEKTYEPLHLLIGTNNSLYGGLAAGRKAADIELANREIPSYHFSVTRNGRNDGDYAYTLKFTQQQGETQPSLTAVGLTIGERSHEEPVAGIANLPSFYAMKERVLSGGIKRTGEQRKIEHGSDAQKLKP